MIGATDDDDDVGFAGSGRWRRRGATYGVDRSTMANSQALTWRQHHGSGETKFRSSRTAHASADFIVIHRLGLRNLNLKARWNAGKPRAPDYRGAVRQVAYRRPPGPQALARPSRAWVPGLRSAGRPALVLSPYAAPRRPVEDLEDLLNAWTSRRARLQ